MPADELRHYSLVDPSLGLMYKVQFMNGDAVHTLDAKRAPILDL